MKRKIISVCLAVAVAFSLCGCKNENAQISSASTASTTVASTVASVSKTENPVNPDNTGEAKTDKGFWLYDYKCGNIVWCKDDGTVVYNANLMDIPVSGTFTTGDGSRIFLVDYSVDFSNYEYTYYIRAYDVLTGEAFEIAQIKENFSYLDVYNKKLVLCCNDYNTGDYYETDYSLETYEQIGETRYYPDFVAYDLMKMQPTDSYVGQCTGRMLDEAGCVILCREGQLYKYNENGTEPVDVGYDSVVVRAFNRNGIYISPYGTMFNSVLFYNFEEENVTTLTDLLDSFLGADKGIAYFEEKIEAVFGAPEIYLCAFDENSMTTEVVYQTVKHPGLGDFLPVTDGYRIQEGNIFFVSDDGRTAGWYEACRDGNEWEIRPLAAQMFTPDFFRYGTVEYDSFQSYCPYCGLPVAGYYEEYFKLDSSVKNAEKINAFLLENHNYSMQGDRDESEYMMPRDESDCEFHKSSRTMTDSRLSVQSVSCVGSHYVTVNMEGYYYSAGAIHGYPMRFHNLFDTETGENVLLSDIYDGEDWEFYDILAKKTVEDMESKTPENGYEYSPYFIKDPDELYNEVGKMFYSIDSINVRYEPEGLVVEFEPYVLAPYSEGYVEIFIGYDELNMNLNSFG